MSMNQFMAIFNMADARVSNVRYYPIRDYDTSRAQLFLKPITETDRLN